MSLRTPHRLLLIAGAASALAPVPVAANAGTAPGHYTTIDVPGAASTVAVGVNDWGVVSGFYFDRSGSQHGFIDRDGRFTTVDAWMLAPHRGRAPAWVHQTTSGRLPGAIAAATSTGSN